VSSKSIQPFGHNGHGPKIGGGAVPLSLEGSWVPIQHNMAGPEAYMHAKFHLDPSNRLATIHQRHRQKDTHDSTGQLSDSIERTVLQTVAQKWTHYSTTSKSSGVPMISFLWPCYVIGQAIVFLPCIFFLLSFSSSSFFFSSPNLSGRIEIGCLPHFYTWCGLSGLKK